MKLSCWFAPVLWASLAGAAWSAEPPLIDELAALEPLLGTWEVTAQTEGGGELWSRGVYAAGVGGRTIEARIFARAENSEPYLRYFTVFSFDTERDKIVADEYGFDGGRRTYDYAVENGVLRSEWMGDGALVRNEYDLTRPARIGWTVSVKPPGAEEFRAVVRGTWHRKENTVRAIDSSLFAASGPEVRSFVERTTIAAPAEVVYAAWTDGAAFARAYDPERSELRADIDLAIGGRYEWLWDGENGSNGCQVLSYVPNRMISFSWNAPPSQPESRARHTWVVVELAPAADGAGTELTLTHLGFGTAAHWDETFDYFQKAWPHVLAQFKLNLEDKGR